MSKPSSSKNGNVIEEEKTGNSIQQPNKSGYSVSVTNKKQESSSEEDEDENFEEPVEQRVIPNFLMNIPGVTATDSMAYRIEALRVHLEKMIGDELFLAAYKHLVVRILVFYF